MYITKLAEYGMNEALLGLSLNYKKEVRDMPKVLAKLAAKDGGHNKVLEFIQTYWDITAARYFWQEFDTYRIGVSKSSESTIHNLLDRDLCLNDLEETNCPQVTLAQNKQVRMFNMVKEELKESSRAQKINELKKILPESYLQRRIVCVNYKALRGMLIQRKSHVLSEWKLFCSEVERQVNCPSFLKEESKNV
jgi:actin-related protein